MAKRNYYIFFFVCFSAVFISSCRHYASQYQLRKSRLTAADSVFWYDSAFCEEKYILDTLLKGRFIHSAFNGNVICALKGKVFYEKTLGYKDIFTKDSLELSNSFQLASVSKPFTSTAILQLCERGKISLSDTVDKLIPGFPYKGITVKMLLCHRSGLPDYIEFTDRYYRRTGCFPECITNDSVLGLMKQIRPRMLAKPNQKYDYSNTGFMVLASIVERVTGTKFNDYLEENIFGPAGMKNTYVYNMQAKNLKPLSVRAFEDDALVPESYHNGVVGDKGVYSTVEDLLLFDKALKRGELLSKQWQDSAYAKEVPEWEGDQNYGLGWRLRTGLHNENIIYHTGWWKGFRSIFMRDLTRDLTIVVVDNVRKNGFLSLNELLWVFDKNKPSTFF
ncbi:MAG TPA: serine hydrolase domain-containing protein [Flavobacteriales bacterium]|nr:serine hydrolase domain-containing protein [Flavobacteriales bacterium]